MGAMFTVTILSILMTSVFAAGSDESVLQQVLDRLDMKDMEIKTLTDRVQGMERQLEDMRQKCSGTKDMQISHNRKRQNVHNVAFHAEMMNFTMHAQAHQNLVFDNVVTNIGNGYNKNTGVFVTPVPGVYVFSVTLMADPNHYDRYQIMKNGSELLGNLLAHAPASAYDTTAQTIVIVLGAGDQISVQHSDPDGFAHGHAYSTFSGFLQQEDYSSSILG